MNTLRIVLRIFTLICLAIGGIITITFSWKTSAPISMGFAILALISFFIAILIDMKVEGLFKEPTNSEG